MTAPMRNPRNAPVMRNRLKFGMRGAERRSGEVDAGMFATPYQFGRGRQPVRPGVRRELYDNPVPDDADRMGGRGSSLVGTAVIPDKASDERGEDRSAGLDDPDEDVGVNISRARSREP